MSRSLTSVVQYVIPQRALSGLVYRLSRWRGAPFLGSFMRWFVRRYRVDLTEAAETSLAAYPDFNSFFTRALRSDARPLAPGAGSICCPVDGYVSQIGTLQGSNILQAKGHSYSLRQLLGGSAERAEAFKGGAFATLYLSPGDYHRVHMPLAGRLTEMVHIPGRLFSVSPACVEGIPEVFTRNERVVTLFETDAGPMALVLVGALNVGSMETVWAGQITPPRGRCIAAIGYADQGEHVIRLERGEEMGRFNLGSTVIVLFGPGQVQWDSALGPQTKVRMGVKLGAIAQQTA